MSPVVVVGSATTTPAIRSTAMVASTAATVATATVVTRMSLDRRVPLCDPGIRASLVSVGAC